MHLNVEFWGRPDSTVMSVGPQSAARLLTDIKFFSHLLCTACRWASSFRRHCRLTRGSEPICAVQQKNGKGKKGTWSRLSQHGRLGTENDDDVLTSRL